jgi:hypothetical protein
MPYSTHFFGIFFPASFFIAPSLGAATPAKPRFSVMSGALFRPGSFFASALMVDILSFATSSNNTAVGRTSAMKTARLQLSRKKGFNLQDASNALNGLECVKVGRPSLWGNPYSLPIYGRDLSLAYSATAPLAGQPDSICGAAYEAHHQFLKRIDARPLEAARSELKEKNVACFCSTSSRCHGDILLAAARGEVHMKRLYRSRSSGT